MKNVFLESGKSLLIFANLGTILLFLKEFFTNKEQNSLFLAILFFVGFYIIGNSLIYISSFLEEKNGE